MSSENIERVREILERWATGDFRVDDSFDRHLLFVMSPDFPDSGVYVGKDGLRDYMLRFLEPWERLVIEAESLRAAGDTVVAHVHQHGTGSLSGAETELSYFILFTFRGERIVRMETLKSEGEALEAAGLR